MIAMLCLIIKKSIVIEINPRQSGSIAISQEAGFKVFENLIKLYLRKKINPATKFHEKKLFPINH